MTDYLEPDLGMLGFVAASTQDRCDGLRNDPVWLQAAVASDAARFMLFVEDRPLMRIADGELSGPYWVTAEQLTMLGNTDVPVLLERQDNLLFAAQTAWSVEQFERQELPFSNPDAAAKLIDLRSLAEQGVLPPATMVQLAQAKSLLSWHKTHQFCSLCGVRSSSVDGGYRRHCAACGGSHFPRTDPVIIVAVTRGDRFLLGRGINFPEKRYSALAGFVEPGENIEAATRREIREEAGLEIGRVSYVTSQPWPFPSSLMIGLKAESLSEEVRFDASELQDARWFSRDEVITMVKGCHPEGIELPPPMAIARTLIDIVLAGG